MASDLDGLSILIVGGTTGLGLSAAKALAARGARLTLTGRSEENLQRALAEVGGATTGCTGDAADSAAADAAVALAVETHGRLDALYHVAGGSGRRHGDGPLHELSDEGWRYTIDLNLSSIAWSNRAAVRQFLAQGKGGAILNMGSVLGYSPSPRFFASHAYAATKSAVIGFTRSIASYYAEHDIRANVIAPALVETPMSRRASDDETIQDFIRTKQPLDGGRNGVPADLDGAACFLLSPAARFVTGQLLAVDGGWSVTEGRVPE